MSIVLNVVSKSRAWIMSDGLAKDSKTGKKISGSLKKFELLNPKLYIGYTGTLEVAKDTVANLRSLCPALESATIETAVAYTIKILKKYTSDIVPAQFLFTGLSDDGSFATAAIKGDLSLDLLAPDAYGMRTAVLHKDYSGGLERDIEGFLAKGLPVDDAVKRGMSKTVQRVSLRDPFVNRTTFFEIIKR